MDCARSRVELRAASGRARSASRHVPHRPLVQVKAPSFLTTSTGVTPAGPIRRLGKWLLPVPSSGVPRAKGYDRTINQGSTPCPESPMRLPVQHLLPHGTWYALLAVLLPDLGCSGGSDGPGDPPSEPAALAGHRPPTTVRAGVGVGPLTWNADLRRLRRPG